MTHYDRSSLVLCALAAVVCAAPARGQTDCPERPDYRNLRYEENWRYLADPTCANGMFDRLKFLPLDEARQRYLSLGGEARLRYEFVSNGGPRAEDEDDLDLNQAFADWTFHSDGDDQTTASSTPSVRCLRRPRTPGWRD